MFKTSKQIVSANEYESEILDLIQNGYNELTTSDLQGIVSVLVYKISQDESLLDFETRLARSKAQDLQ